MSTSPFDLIKSKLTDFRTLVLTHPQLQPVFIKVASFWQRFGKIITYSSLSLIFLVITAIGINLGVNYARQSTDTTTHPLPITTPTITQTTVFLSPLVDIRSQVQAFDTLLPDPAPPAVDNNISLQIKP